MGMPRKGLQGETCGREGEHGTLGWLGWGILKGRSCGAHQEGYDRWGSAAAPQRDIRRASNARTIAAAVGQWGGELAGCSVGLGGGQVGWAGHVVMGCGTSVDQAVPVGWGGDRPPKGAGLFVGLPWMALCLGGKVTRQKLAFPLR